MTSAFIIMLREGFEAALIVGIILAVLARLDQMRYVKQVGLGVGAAAAASILFAWLADRVSNLFEGAGQEVINGFILFVAAVMITYVVVWVRATRHNLKAHLEGAVEAQVAVRGIGIFLLVFFTVFREGVESVLFLWGAMLSGAGTGLAATLTGGVAGLAAAAGIAWMLFAGGRRIPMTAFFNGTMVLLVLLAAGMLASAAGFWISVDWLPALTYSVWDTGYILPENKGIGAVLSMMLGYNANPTLMEVLVWSGYLGGVGVWLAAGRFKRPVPAGAGA